MALGLGQVALHRLDQTGNQKLAHVGALRLDVARRRSLWGASRAALGSLLPIRHSRQNNGARRIDGNERLRCHGRRRRLVRRALEIPDQLAGGIALRVRSRPLIGWGVEPPALQRQAFVRACFQLRKPLFESRSFIEPGIAAPSEPQERRPFLARLNAEGQAVGPAGLALRVFVEDGNDAGQSDTGARLVEFENGPLMFQRDGRGQARLAGRHAQLVGDILLKAPAGA